MLPFTLDDLNTAVANGRVTERPHPTLPLYIYNYSPEIQYSSDWDDVTTNCRGLILDEQGNIVARPWKKFFNLGQVNLPIQFDTPVEVMDKVDGSLGILYPTENSWAIATRGSFESEQAIHATQVLLNTYRQDFPNFDKVAKDYTFLFEIIFRQNRIVLDYGDMDDLVLLGAVENATGYYLGPWHAEGLIRWNGPVVEVMPYKSISEALMHTDRKNAEGFVIRSHNFLVKVKQPDYVELHRLVTNASPKTCWEQLRNGKSKSEIVSAFPDEFHDYVAGMIDPLLARYEKRVDEISKRYGETRIGFLTSQSAKGIHEFDRGAYARYIRNEKDKKYFFLCLDNRSYRDVLWMELKPREAATV